MADHETVRIEVAFDGGQTISLSVSAKDAAALESALEQGRTDAIGVDAETGRYTIALRRVVYAKRIARESRVGFGQN
jgi:hypothetical protein